MRKVVAGFASSIDGYIESSNKSYDWIIIDKEVDFAEQAKRFDTYFYGRITYESVVSMNNPPLPEIKNFVFSNTLTTVPPEFTLVKGNLREEVNALKQLPGKDIAIFGGASLLASMLDQQLVDELNISFIPVLLGKGKPMVDVLSKKVWVTYLKSKTYSNGTVQITYAVNTHH